MGLARKLLVAVGEDGLVIQNATGGIRNAADEVSGVHIEYGTHKIQRLFTAGSVLRQGGPSLEVHGLIGLISLASYSFLVAITQRNQVAQIHRKPIFVVTDVALIPLSSEEDASKAIAAVGKAVGERQQSLSDASSSFSNESDVSEESQLQQTAEPDETAQPADDNSSGHTSVAEDVIEKQGRYGRFASRWFSKNGWTRRNTIFQGVADPQAIGSVFARKPQDKKDKGQNDQDLVEMDGLTPDGQISHAYEAEEEEKDGIESRPHELVPKLLRYARLFFSSNSFYFSYDHDITRKHAVHRLDIESIPIYRRADPQFFWNRHLIQPFIDSGQYELALPLIQGFVGQHRFVVTKGESTQESEKADINDVAASSDSNASQDNNGSSEELESNENASFLLTLISRRSIRRSGVRYLRRGVDDEGNVANMVETEQILSRPSWDPKDKIYSLLQVRGSIPLYFSQSPYSLKPAPILRHSDETNQASFNKHIKALSERYGKIQIVSLIDGHGVEVKIGEKFQEFAKNFNESGDTLAGAPLEFLWFDFHHECRGLKFENVSHLIDQIESTVDEFGYTIFQENNILKRQIGVVRTNCMDCLDRTGVTQCAIGQHALGRQLQEEGYSIDLRHDENTQWFNILWADNGDAISKQYSSTAALKGDYTRTRKRNMRGALNDLGLTMSRYFNNLVNDYFSQACIDYFLGNVTIDVFNEFESNLTSGDPGISLERIRQNAIATCCDIVLDGDSEELLGGWTLLSPHEPNTLRTLPFEESVLLLTDTAVYCCRFDWDADKLIGFERIELLTITKINYGTYITSALTDTQMNPRHNVGLVITYRSSDDNYIRINTRSPRTLVHNENGIDDIADKKGDSGTGEGELEGKKSKKNENGSTANKEWDILSFFQGNKRNSTRLLAMKILPFSRTVINKDDYTPQIKERDTARLICEEIEHAIMKANNRSGNKAIEGDLMVKETEIISVSEARKQTGIFEHLAYDLKKLVWA